MAEEIEMEGRFGGVQRLPVKSVLYLDHAEHIASHIAWSLKSDLAANAENAAYLRRRRFWLRGE